MLIREASAKRRLCGLGRALLDGASNGRPTRDLIAVIQDTLQHLAAGAPALDPRTSSAVTVCLSTVTPTRVEE